MYVGERDYAIFQTESAAQRWGDANFPVGKEVAVWVPGNELKQSFLIKTVDSASFLPFLVAMGFLIFPIMGLAHRVLRGPPGSVIAVWIVWLGIPLALVIMIKLAGGVFPQMSFLSWLVLLIYIAVGSIWNSLLVRKALPDIDPNCP